MISYQDYISEIKNSTIRKPILKLEFLRKDETPYREIITELHLDGGLDIENNDGMRKSFHITLDNKDRTFFPSIDSNIWIFDKVRLYLGLNINNEDYFISQGLFVMDSPTINNDSSVSINGLDKFSLLDGTLGGELDQTTILSSGTNLNNAIRTLMTISQDDKPPIIDSSIGNETLPYEIIAEEGDPLGGILIELAEAFTCNVFYNEDGYLVFEKKISDSKKGSMWDFNGDDVNETNYIEGSKDFDYSNVYNKIIVIGDNINGSIIRAELENNDLTSDTSIPNVGITRPKVIYDDIIYTVPYALERCKYEMKRCNNVMTDGSHSSIPLYHFNVDRVVKITYGNINSIEERNLIESVSIPFNGGDMNLRLAKTFDIDL